MLGPNDGAVLEAAVRAFRGFEHHVDTSFLADRGNLAFVAADGDTVVGAAWGHTFTDPSGAVGVALTALEVAEAVRERGVGRMLLDAFVREATARGHERMWLLQDAGPRAARLLYEDATDPGGSLGTWWVMG